MELRVPGKLLSGTGALLSFTSCRIVALFDQTTSATTTPETFRPIEGGEGISFTPGELGLLPATDLIASSFGVPAPATPVSALSDAAGNFTLIFPDGLKFAGDKVKIVVHSPEGRFLTQEEFRIAVLGTELLQIDVPDFGTNLGKPVAPTEPTTRRIRGRVIERRGRPLPATLQVLLLGDAQDGEEGDSLTPILVAKADNSGYFSGAIKNSRFDRVVAVVEGIPGEIPVQLENSLVPPRIPILVELPDTPGGPAANDCNCPDSAVPRTPTQDDIADAPGVFAADLGTGQCIRFNVPNRAIEEFNFYSIVRTTEPEISGITTGIIKDEPVTVPNTGPTPSPTTTNIPSTPPPLRTPDADAEELDARIRAALAPLMVTGVQPHWISVESIMRAEVVRAGAKPLPADFFSQIAGWNEGLEWSFGPFHIFNNTKLDEVIKKAVQVAIPPKPPPGIAFPQARATMSAAMSSFTATASTSPELLELLLSSVYAQRGLKRLPKRVPLNRMFPVDWDSTPTFYEATSIAHGHLLHFKQVWYADGYSLGDLLYSLPLAPGQKKLISVVDWERREQATREEFTSAEEGLQAALSRDRDLSEVVSGTLSESMQGGSRNTTVGFGAGKGSAGNGSYYGFNFGGVMGVSGGFGSSDSNAFQASSRDLSSSSLQSLRDRTLQSASAVRNLRSTIVQTARQGEAVRATTEVVANHNHCHAVTIQYFEVLRHFKVTQELTDVQECLFVPLPMTEFTRPKVMRWRESLSLYLKRRELAPAFDATRRIQKNWSEEFTPLARFADELVNAIFGELTLTILIPLPPFPEKPKPKPEETLEETEAAVRKALIPTEGPLGVILTIATLGANQLTNATAEAINSAAKATAQGAQALAESLMNELSAEERFAKFQQEVMPAAAAGFVDQLELYALVGASEVRLNGADFTLVSDYRPGTPLLVSLRGRITTPVSRASISALVIKSGVPLPPGCRAIVNSASLRYETNHFRYSLINDSRVNDDIDLPIVATTSVTTPPAPPLPPLPPGFPTDWIQIPGMVPVRGGNGAMLSAPLDEWEQRAPRLEDVRLSAELIEHLNANLEYYHHAIWWTMDPNRRYLLLDGYEAPNAGGRSVASVVDNTLIGIIGNSLILQVAPGNRLDPGFKMDTGVTLLEHYDPQSPAPPSRVSLPTRGVFAEAVMGDCNACEKIDDSRFWRWEESPIDEPPALDVTAVASRRSEPNFGTPTPFPTPIVSIQNAPQAPDPTGLAAALETLTKQSFPDITGLTGTQANAAAAFAKAMDTALAFGKEASALAQQAAMVKSKDKVIDTIDKAKQDGKISDEDEKKHTNNLLDRMTMTPPPLVEAVGDPDEWAPWPGTGDGGTPPKPKPTKTTPTPPRQRIIPISIKLRVFVPSELWSPFAGSPIVFNGDDRTQFSLTAPGSRLEVEYSLKLDVETFKVVDNPVITPVTFGIARVYWTTDTVAVADRPIWSRARRDDAVDPIEQMRMKEEPGRFEPELLQRKDKIAVIFRFNEQPYFPWEGKPPGFLSKIPVVGGLLNSVTEALTMIANPNIDLAITVQFVNEHDGIPRILVSGSHNGFPSYELYVNGEDVYHWGETAQLGSEPLVGLNRSIEVVDPRPLRTLKSTRKP